MSAKREFPMTERPWTPNWTIDADWPNNRQASCTMISGDVGGLHEHRAMAQVITLIDGTPYRQGEANARLIAAAPDLYEALERVLALYIDEVEWRGLLTKEQIDTMSELVAARAALAKANPQTQDEPYE